MLGEYKQQFFYLKNFFSTCCYYHVNRREIKSNLKQDKIKYLGKYKQDRPILGRTKL